MHSQCQRRGQQCEYPTESRRGLRKKKASVDGVLESSVTDFKAKGAKKSLSRVREASSASLSS
jgi:hypothetical protein